MKRNVKNIKYNNTHLETMNTTSKLRAAAVAIAVAMTCGTANAQHWRWHCRPRPVVTVVSRPAVTVHVNNHFTQKERFKIAMAYLKSHSYLTVKKYTSMTELSKNRSKSGT